MKIKCDICKKEFQSNDIIWVKRIGVKPINYCDKCYKEGESAK
jgi:uncharacterized protein YlaI